MIWTDLDASHSRVLVTEFVVSIMSVLAKSEIVVDVGVRVTRAPLLSPFIFHFHAVFRKK